jgi:hypothetical protein
MRVDTANFRVSHASGITVFGAAPEECFLLKLVCEPQQISSNETAEVDWRRIRRAAFALPELYEQRATQRLGSLPSDVTQSAKACYLHQLSYNRRRLGTIEDLAKRFRQSGIRAVFFGAAAELVLFASDSKFIAALSMDDIDVLCSEGELPALESVLLAIGYQNTGHSQFSHIGASSWTLKSAQQVSDSKINLHTHLDAKRNFLPCVFSLLTQNNRQVRLGEEEVLIPAPNEMVAHALHQSAHCLKQARKIQIDSFAVDSFAHPIDISTLPDILSRQMDFEQLRMLLRLRNLLTRLADNVDFATIASLLSTADSEPLRTVVNTASFYLGSVCPLKHGVTLDVIEAQRHRRLEELFRTSALNRFEQHIAQQASATNLVKEGFKRSLRALIPVPVRKLIRGRLTASPRKGGEL